MSKQITAKFRVTQKTEYAGGLAPAISMTPVYPGVDASDEDKAFWEATPNGQLQMNVTKPDVADFFETGKPYYLTFVEAE